VFSVERRIHGADTHVERRVRRPKAPEDGPEALGKKEVAELGGADRLDARPEGVSADLLQRTRDAGGIASELDRGGVGEELPLARNGRLDEPAEEIADVAQDHEDDAQRQNDR